MIIGSSLFRLSSYEREDDGLESNEFLDTKPSISFLLTKYSIIKLRGKELRLNSSLKGRVSEMSFNRSTSIPIPRNTFWE